MKNLLLKFKIPLSIIIGGYVSYLLIAYPLESYTLPVIIMWMPDIIGWNAFFIFIGIIASLMSWGILSSITDDKDDQENK